MGEVVLDSTQRRSAYTSFKLSRLLSGESGYGYKALRMIAKEYTFNNMLDLPLRHTGMT